MKTLHFNNNFSEYKSISATLKSMMLITRGVISHSDAIRCTNNSNIPPFITDFNLDQL